jgi:hypothetical protein
MQTKDATGIHIEGHIKIYDPESKEIYIDKRNAIHYENISVALAQSLADSGNGFVYNMAFGNGGTSIDPTGIITYLTPNTSGTNASLYNQTYAKVVNQNSANNTDPSRNFIETRHTTGTNYTDLFVTCLLDYGEPSTQSAFDVVNNSNSQFVFDELGLQAYNANGSYLLLTHVIFHPVLKSLNRLVQIDYTVRIQSLTGLVGV